MSEQSQGGMNGPTGGEYPPNPHFNQYGGQQHNMRGGGGNGSGYPQSSMSSQVPNSRAGMGQGGNAGMGPPGYSNNPNQQRFMMGNSNNNMGPQQGGAPTPTLNRLLQNPNNNPRFPSGYGGDYNMGQQPKGQEMSHNYPNQGWGNQQRPVNAYQQMQGNQNFRNQVNCFSLHV